MKKRERFCPSCGQELAPVSLTPSGSKKAWLIIVLLLALGGAAALYLSGVLGPVLTGPLDTLSEEPITSGSAASVSQRALL